MSGQLASRTLARKKRRKRNERGREHASSLRVQPRSVVVVVVDSVTWASNMSTAPRITATTAKPQPEPLPEPKIANIYVKRGLGGGQTRAV